MTDSSPNTNGRSPTTNLWAKIDARNPYLHNVFALFGIDPDAGEREFQRQCRRVRRQLEAGQSREFHGYEVTNIDLARADDLASKQDEYAAERLLAHTVHKIDLQAFEAAMAAIEAVEFPSPDGLLPLAVRNLSFLMALIPNLDNVAGSKPQLPTPTTFAEVAQPDLASEHTYDC